MFINDSVFDKPEDAGQVKEEVLNIIHGPKNRECFMVEVSHAVFSDSSTTVLGTVGTWQIRP